MIKQWSRHYTFCKKDTNKLITVVLGSIVFVVFGIYIQPTSGQNMINESGTIQNKPASSIQVVDFKSLAGKGSLSPVFLVPIDAVGEDVYFAWSANKTGNFEIFFTMSPDSGKDFQTAINLSNSSEAESTDVSLKAQGKNVYVSWWENYKNGTRTPVIKVSNDNGKSFGDKVFLSNLIRLNTLSEK